MSTKKHQKLSHTYPFTILLYWYTLKCLLDGNERKINPKRKIVTKLLLTWSKMHYHNGNSCFSWTNGWFHFFMQFLVAASLQLHHSLHSVFLSFFLSFSTHTRHSKFPAIYERNPANYYSLSASHFSLAHRFHCVASFTSVHVWFYKVLQVVLWKLPWNLLLCTTKFIATSTGWQWFHGRKFINLTWCRRGKCGECRAHRRKNDRMWHFPRTAMAVANDLHAGDSITTEKFWLWKIVCHWWILAVRCHAKKVGRWMCFMIKLKSNCIIARFFLLVCQL